MTKDELKNRISMALKDPILQQGFEIICKENAELKEEVKNIEDLATVAYMQGAESQKKKADKQLAKAKEIIKNLIDDLTAIDGEQIRELEAVKEAEQFLKEIEKRKNYYWYF